MKKNPSSDLVLVAAGGAALYFFWPQISAMFGAATPAAAPPGTPAPGPCVTDPSGPACGLKPTASQLTQGAIAQAQQAANAAIPPAAPGQPQMQISINAASQAPAPPATATVDPSFFQQANISQLTPQQISDALAPHLAGTRRLAGTSAASIAMAALNQMLTENAPELTNYAPIGQQTPGAVRLPNGCWKYGNTPVLVNCPPGAGAPAGRPVASGTCLPGFTMDATGTCANTTDQAQLAFLNSTPYQTPADLPSYPVNASALAAYATTIGVKPGSILAAMLGLPSNPSNGTIEQGLDGFSYQTVAKVYVRQGTATQLSRPTGPIGPRLHPLPAGTKLKGLGAVTSALPITNATLIAASSDPNIAALVSNDPRAMLTIGQWNYYYSQSCGILQKAPPWPEVDPQKLISAIEYQAWRQAAGLGVDTPGKLGTVRNSRPGMFPLGGISDGPIRRPFIQPGNTNVYRIPGRGPVRLGLIHSGGGNHRWARSPFPRPADWRMAE